MGQDTGPAPGCLIRGKISYRWKFFKSRVRSLPGPPPYFEYFVYTRGCSLLWEASFLNRRGSTPFGKKRFSHSIILIPFQGFSPIPDFPASKPLGRAKVPCIYPDRMKLMNSVFGLERLLQRCPIEALFECGLKYLPVSLVSLL